MIVRGVLASLLVLSSGIGAWAACLPSEPAITPWPTDAGSDSQIDANVALCNSDMRFDRNRIDRVFSDNDPGTDKQGAFLSYDERHLYFGLGPIVPDAAAYKGTLYVATRADKNEPFRSYSPLDGPEGPFVGNLRYPTLSSDETTIVFDINGGNYASLAFATRENASAPFQAPQPLAIRHDGDLQLLAPFFHETNGGKELWFTRFPGEGPEGAATTVNERIRIVGSDLGSPDAFATPEPLPSLPPKTFPVVVSHDGLEIFYATTNSRDDTSMYVASRDPTTGAISQQRLLDELNTLRIERPGWLSPDRCRLYFTASRADSSEPSYLDIFVATRTPK